MLPQVRQIVQDLQAAKQQADDARREYEHLDATHARGNGYEMRREILATKIIEEMKVVRQQLEAIQKIGCEIKDIKMGLIDFQSMREGRVVNLCWKISEETIGYWHSLDTGFASRRPL